MGISGNMLRDAIVKYIASWSAGLAVKTEVNLGMRFMGTPRRIDLLVYNPKNNNSSDFILIHPYYSPLLLPHSGQLAGGFTACPQ